ncbi:MAG: hypothetical protein P8Y81_09010 [Ignavibacteriaceae bacterium]
MKNILRVLFIIMILGPNCFPQDSTESFEYFEHPQQFNNLFSNFDKQLNTYHLNTGIILNGDYSNFNLNLSENFRSTLFRSSSITIRDEQYFKLHSQYKLNENYKLGFSVNSSILSDDRNIQLNEASINYLTIFSEINIADHLMISPFGGYSTNKQVGILDNGPVYGIEGITQNISSPDFILNSSFRFRNEDISPRKNLLRYVCLSLINPFNPQVTNFITGRYTSNRKDFYIPADSITSSTFDIVNNIEGRTESVFLAEDRLRYKDFLKNFDLDMTSGLNWRTIARDKRYKTAKYQSYKIFDTKIDELVLFFETSVFYRSDFFNGSIKLNVAERDEKHITKNFEGIAESFFNLRSDLESRKNNNSTRATLAFTGNFNISQSDRLVLSLYHNKLKYDTPSTENDDDRDELLSIIRMGYYKKLSPYFRVFANTEATISHVVYIFASRSSNNNINRVLRFSTGGYYNGANVSTLNSFEVSANYTVYDFEDVSSNLKSYSFRQFTANDSTRIKFGKRFGFAITGYIKISENADLNWGEFSERPTRFLREIFADPMFLLTDGNSHIGIGARYFALNTFSYKQLEKVPDSKYLSIGPLVEILYNLFSSLYIKLNGWYEFISINDASVRERVNLITTLNWKF